MATNSNQPTKLSCANCGGDYALAHRWAGNGKGACKNPPPGSKTFFRDSSAPAPGDGRRTA